MHTYISLFCHLTAPSSHFIQTALRTTGAQILVSNTVSLQKETVFLGELAGSRIMEIGKMRLEYMQHGNMQDEP